MANVKACKCDIMHKGREGIEAWLDSTNGCAVFCGHGHFEDLHTLGFGNDLLHTDRIFLKIGSCAMVPDVPGLCDVKFLTQVSILELYILPSYVVIVGAIYLALEFAQVYFRFGAWVTVVGRVPRLAFRED